MGKIRRIKLYNNKGNFYKKRKKRKFNFKDVNWNSFYFISLIILLYKNSNDNLKKDLFIFKKLIYKVNKIFFVIINL